MVYVESGMGNGIFDFSRLIHLIVSRCVVYGCVASALSPHDRYRLASAWRLRSDVFGV